MCNGGNREADQDYDICSKLKIFFLFWNIAVNKKNIHNVNCLVNENNCSNVLNENYSKNCETWIVFLVFQN